MTELYNKLLTYNFKQLFDKKGYAFFTKGEYNLNIIGIRSINDHKVTNKFDDYIVVVYQNKQKFCQVIYNVTTQPGLDYILNPSNKKGTAILAEGQYRGVYKLGKHKGLNALIQNKNVKVYRDNNRDRKYDYDKQTIDEGRFGINIHRAGTTSKFINNWSAGCQVFANSSQFDSFLRLCNEQIKHGYGKTFTYTLINERDL